VIERAPGATDSALVEAFLIGEPEAVRTLDGWIVPVVRHRAWRLGEAAVEDLVQEIRFKLLKLFEAGAFRGNSSLKTYVQSTAKYTCLDAIRRARVRRAEELTEEHRSSPRDQPDVELERTESLRLCYRVLSSLPEACRRLLRLVLEREMSYESMAEELGVAMGTVKSRLARCRDRAVALRAEFLGGRR